MMVTLLVLAAAPMSGAQGSEPGEYELKAAFLFNFAKFVDWPADTFRNPRSPFLICILGKDPFGQAIDDTLRGKALGSHPVSVARAKDTSEARRCQIVFVSAAESRNVRAILGGLQGSKALVVGESEGFAEAGGMIQFTLEENHVRFLINPEAGEREGLRFSSKLLALATIVHNSRASGRS